MRRPSVEPQIAGVDERLLHYTGQDLLDRPAFEYRFGYCKNGDVACILAGTVQTSQCLDDQTARQRPRIGPPAPQSGA